MNAELTIPSVLCGTHKQVRPRWRAIVKKAVKTGDWNSALEGVEMVPLERTPGGLVLQPNRYLVGEHVLLYEVIAELHDIFYHGNPGDERFPLQKRLLFGGINHFWFCLGLLGSSDLRFPRNPDHEGERKQIAKTVLGSLLHWWPVFCQYDSRFFEKEGTGDENWIVSNAWPDWASRLYWLCGDLGLDEETQLRPFRMACKERIGPEEAAAQALIWMGAT